MPDPRTGYYVATRDWPAGLETGIPVAEIYEALESITDEATGGDDMPEPRRWLYGLTADEWLHLAAEGHDSEVAPCCGDIGDLRDNLNALATCQGEGEDWLMRAPVLTVYEAAAEEHGLSDRAAFPLLHRVLDGIREVGDA